MEHPYSPASLSPAQWWCVLKEVRNTSNRTNLNLVSAGIAFYALMALIPGLAATLALFGTFGDPQFLAEQSQALRGIAPDAALDILDDQVRRLLAVDRRALIAGGLFNIALSLWSALQGVRWLLLSLTIVNRRTERRRWFRQYVVAGLFTMGGVAMVMFTTLLLGGAPLILAQLRLSANAETWTLMLRWPILGAGAVAAAAALYRWGPLRRPPPMRWLWPGAIGAPVLWVVTSSVFTLALRAFPSFGAAYGSLASVVAFMLWLYVSAMIFLLGGALNAELEYFTDAGNKPPAGGPAAPKAAARGVDPLKV